MRNLLGRLNARSPEELGRIAAAWQVPVTAGDRHGQVGQLYRALTDPRTARDAWDALAADERPFVRLLAVSDDAALTLAEIAANIGLAEDAAREIAIRLYRKGIVAREGDDDPLPVGAMPRLFLPRELGFLFRRVQDEIEAGDLSTTPLRALLSLLDDAEIEESAQIWGLRVIPGLRERDELTNRLLEQVGDVDRVAQVASSRHRDTALIWQRVCNEPNSQSVPLAEAAAAAGLSGGDSRQAKRLREALTELERALLVWHTYRPDGSRWLFVPAEIRAPAPPAGRQIAPLTPLLETVDDPPWRHPHALAWDLLTTLRALQAPDRPRVHDPASLPHPWRRRLNRRLWLRGPDVPPSGYLEFLIALARAEGLLRGGDPSGEELLDVTPAVRLWRDRGFVEQTTRLQWWWLANNGWPEGESREDVEVWGADWRGFRRKLLSSLTALDDEIWYPVESVAAWLASRDPDMLGATFTAATARQTGHEGDASGRRAAIAEVAAVTLATSFAWFGLVDIATIPRGASAVRLTAAGRATAAAQPLPATGDERHFEVRPSLQIALRSPSPLQVWSVSAFAELERLGEESVYRLTERAIAGALDAGFDVRQVSAFLVHQSESPLPPEVEAALTERARDYRRVRIRPALILTPDDPASLPDIVQALTEAALIATEQAGAIVVEGPDGAVLEPTVLDALRNKGFTPQRAKSTQP